MVRFRIGSLCALVTLAWLLPVTVSAQDVVTGTVKQIDERSGVIVFDDGRAVHTTSRTVVLVDRPVERLAAVSPGTRVIVLSPEPAINTSPAASPAATSVSPFGDPSAFGARGLQAP
jgi:hypothetical protein